jgi:hypothetical protein
MTTCLFCNAAVGDQTEVYFGSVCNGDHLGETDFELCDFCNRMVCMECAVFHWPEAGRDNRYLCPDCGHPEHVYLERMGAPMLLDIEWYHDYI